MFFSDEVNRDGWRFLRLLLAVVPMAALILFVFSANRPVLNIYPGNGDEVCSKNLSADDYQTCQVITDEGHAWPSAS